jgi:uncharacterized protein YxjI
MINAVKEVATMDFSSHKTLEFRRKFFKIFGAEIEIRDSEGHNLVGFIKMKAWKLREDIRIYSDKSRSTELLAITARQIIDFAATYNVTDSTSSEPIMSIRRKGLRSTFVRDHWEISTPQGDPAGVLQETSSGLALARRYLGIIPFVGELIDLVFAFIPQTYQLRDTTGATLAQITHRKNPILVKFTVDFVGSSATLDSRAAVAVTALLSVIDASKN